MANQSLRWYPNDGRQLIKRMGKLVVRERRRSKELLPFWDSPTATAATMTTVQKIKVRIFSFIIVPRTDIDVRVQEIEDEMVSVHMFFALRCFS